MQSEIQFAGFGGQGIMVMGQILAQAAMAGGFEVVWIPSYGPEMRGGTAYCTVVISDRLIGSPIIRNPGHLVAMNRPSLEKFASTVKSGGVIFINSSIISIDAGREDVDVIRVPKILEMSKPRILLPCRHLLPAVRSLILSCCKKRLKINFPKKKSSFRLTCRRLKQAGRRALINEALCA